jgi:multisubunit Na+/H+ antiporter MnhF subunit
MRTTLQRWLDSPRVSVLAPLTTLAIGLFFVFVWAPHPWGWRGIDQYDELAKELALGLPFSTTDVPWGYTYYLAIFYRFFGALTWAPVTGQVFINALTPLLLFMLAKPAVGQRVAALAAWITAIFSFNTVYASTQSSDAICTVLFLLSLLSFVRGHRRASLIAFAVSGALSGIVPQFRPNMILLPVMVIAAYALWPPRGTRRLAQCSVFLFAMTLMLMPWIVRNYRYTGTVLPTSTHGGIQLWYGTLQTGPYLESRAHNPRSIFASPAFPYTSIEAPIAVSAGIRCVPDGSKLRLAYRTDRDGQVRFIDPASITGHRYAFEIPAQASPSVVYYFLEAGGATMPLGGNADPYLYFVSDDHLGDLDARREMLDIFDVIRLVRLLAWQEPLPTGSTLDITGDGLTDTADLAAAVAHLLPQARNPYAALDVADRAATIRLSDGSRMAVPKTFSGKQTDLDVDGNLAGALVSRSVTMTSLHAAAEPVCPLAEEVRVNDVFYRREPHEMRRYTALAFDNIGRDPMAFIAASAYRMVRLFIIRGTDDQMTTHQFPLSRLIFQAGLLASLAYFAAFLAGVAIAARARSPFLYALIPIAYVPLTICFVLTNMRYTITVQPLMFVFVAMTVAAVLRIGGPATEPHGREV